MTESNELDVPEIINQCDMCGKQFDYAPFLAEHDDLVCLECYNEYMPEDY